MSAYQSNGKVKPPTNVASSTTSIKIAEKAPPSPMLPHGGHAQNEGTPTTSAVHAFGNEHSGASLNAKSRRLRDISQEYKRRRFDNEKIGAPTDFSATIGKQRKSENVPVHTRRSICAPCL